MSNLRYETEYGLNFEQKEKLKYFVNDEIMGKNRDNKNLKILHNINQDNIFKIVFDTDDKNDIQKLKLFIKNDLNIDLKEKESLKDKLKNRIEKMKESLSKENLNDAKKTIALITVGTILSVVASYSLTSHDIQNKINTNTKNNVDISNTISGEGIVSVLLSKGYWDQFGETPPKGIQELMDKKELVEKQRATDFKENLKFMINDRTVDIQDFVNNIKEKIEISQYVKEHKSGELKDVHGNKLVFPEIKPVELIKLGTDVEKEKSDYEKHVDKMNNILNNATKIVTDAYLDLSPKNDLTPKKSNFDLNK